MMLVRSCIHPRASTASRMMLMVAMRWYVKSQTFASNICVLEMHALVSKVANDDSGFIELRFDFQPVLPVCRSRAA